MKKNDRKSNETDDDESVVESVVNDVLPGMGNLVKNLRKRSPELDQKIKEKEQEIKKRLEEGYSPEPTVTHSVKIRSLVPSGPKKAEKKAEERPENKTIEPITDIFNEGNQLRIVIEMPGVTMGKIHIAIKGRSLEVSAKENGKRYKKEIPLPWHGKIAKERYQNGILELILEQNDH
jgi:HSP20 family molecular chaperone IbpA